MLRQRLLGLILTITGGVAFIAVFGVWLALDAGWRLLEQQAATERLNAILYAIDSGRRALVTPDTDLDGWLTAYDRAVVGVEGSSPVRVVGWHADAPDLPDDARAFRDAPPSVIVLEPVSDQSAWRTFSTLPGADGTPIYLVRIDIPRLDASANDTIFGVAVTAIIVLAGAVAVAAYLGAERWLVAPIERLRGEVVDLTTRYPSDTVTVGTANPALRPLQVAVYSLIAAAQAHAQTIRSEERRATSEIAKQSTFLETILGALDQGVVYGSDGRIHYVNRAMCQLSGYEREELVGERHALLFNVSKSNPHARQGLQALQCKDGTTIDITVTVVPNIPFEGQHGALTIVRDITREKALEERKSRFMANASHELRTPLANLVTRLYLMRQQPDRMQQHLEVLDHVIAHMRQLVEDLMDVSRFQSGTISLHRERHRMQELIRRVVDMQIDEAERKGLRLELVLTAQDADAFVDKARFLQVLTNLIVNAINYTPSGGTIWVELERIEDTLMPLLIVRVRDTGVGIDAEHLPHIFQPFYRASSDTQGSGLGLAICKEIVEQHGGELSVTSQVGVGTTFTIQLLALIKGNSSTHASGF